MRNRLISLLGVVAMLLTFVPQNIAVAADNEVLYFYEDFAGRGKAQHLRSMSYNPSGNEIVREDEAVCIKMKGAASNPSLVRSFDEAPLVGDVVIEADIMVKKLGGCSPRIAVRSIGSGAAGGSEIYPLIISAAGKVTAFNNNNVIINTINEGTYYKFSFVFHVENGTCDVYLDGEIVHSAIDYRSSLSYEFSEITSLLFNTRSADNSSETEYYIDNVRMYKGVAPLTASEFASVRWTIAKTSSSDTSPAMVKAASADILAFYKGSENYIEYGEIKKSASAINSIEDFSSVLGNVSASELKNKNVLSDKTGLTIISDKAIDLSWREDRSYLSALCAELIYQRPEGTELINKLKENYPNNAHPRLLGDEDDFARLKNEISNNATKAQWYKELKNEADRYLKQAVCTFPETVTATTSFIDQAIELKEMSSCLALVYRIEGEADGYKYAERLADELRAWADQEVWGAYSMLGLGRAVNGIAFAYDWLYDILDTIDPELKSDIKTAVKNNFYAEVSKDYYNVASRTRSYRWSQRVTGDNWNTTINSAVIMAAIAFGDEEGFGEEYAYLLDEAMYSIEAAFNMLAPDGAWFEGPAYWTPTVEAMVWAQAGLEKAIGSSYGLSDVPGMKFAPYYLHEMSSSTGIFNFNFAHYRGYSCPILMYYANRYDDSSLMQLCVNQYEKYKGDYDGGYDYWMTGDALLLSGAIPDTSEINLPLDSYYRDTEAVSMRSSFDMDKEFFVGFHSGYNGAQNAQLDIGTFIVEAYGNRFITDFGPEVYAIADASGSIFKAYMNRAEGANAYIVNPSADYMDQELQADCYFQKFETNDSSAFAITDMTEAYGGKLAKAMRGMKMTNNRSSVILRDEIVCKEPSEIYWGMHTPAKVSIEEEGKRALLEMNGEYMEVRILSEQGTFIAAKAEPLPTTFALAGQSTHPDITKLAMSFDNAEELELSLCFTPLGEDKDREISYPSDLALDDWQLDELKADAIALDSDGKGAKTKVVLNGSNAYNPKKLSLIIAAYNEDNELCDIAIEDKTLSLGDNEISVRFDTSFDPTDKIIKTFLFDMTTLTPYNLR